MKFERDSSGKVARICAISVIIICLIVLIGWIANLPFLKNMIPEANSMKVSSAFLIIISSLNLYITSYKLNKSKKIRYKNLSLLLSLLVITTIMVLIFLTLFGEYPVSEQEFNALDLSILSPLERVSLFGVPSIATILSLILFNSAISLKINSYKNSRYFFNLVILVIIISVFTILNHLFNFFVAVPYAPFWETGMAIKTAFCFFLLSLGAISIRD
ncbi:MAG: hypothetical protein AABW79_03140 [Nanoarchaeota archaeon]